MKIMKKLMALALASALALTLLTGCGGGGGGGSIKVNGQTVTINKSRFQDFENGFTAKMETLGYKRLTYSAELTDELEKDVKQAAKQYNDDSYIALAWRIYEGDPNWGEIVQDVTGKLKEVADKNRVDYSDRSYGYLVITNEDTGAHELMVVISNEETRAVV